MRALHHCIGDHDTVLFLHHHTAIGDPSSRRGASSTLREAQVRVLQYLHGERVMLKSNNVLQCRRWCPCFWAPESAGLVLETTHERAVLGMLLSEIRGCMTVAVDQHN